MIEHTKQEYWQDTCSALGLPISDDVEAMKKESTAEIKKRTEIIIGNERFLDKGALDAMGIEIKITCIVKYGFLYVKKDARRLVIYTGDKLDAGKFKDVVYHELGHACCIDKDAFTFFAHKDLDVPIVFRYMKTPGEYETTAEDFATELGAWLAERIPLRPGWYQELYTKKEKKENGIE